MKLIFDFYVTPINPLKKIRVIWMILLLLNSAIMFSQRDNYSSPNFIVILVDDQGWSGTSVQMKKVMHPQRVIIIIRRT